MSSKRLSVLDAGFLQMEGKHTPMHIGGLALYRMPKDAGKDYLLEMRKSFAEYQALRYPFGHCLETPERAVPPPRMRLDPEFDLEYHVRHSALPQPGRYRELFELVSRLHGIPLDRTRPLWEFHLIEGLPDNQFASYTKIHHALMDGSAGTRMLQGSLNPNSRKRHTPPFWSAELQTEHVAAFKKETANATEALLAQFRSQTSLLPELVKTGQQMLEAALRPEQSKLQLQYSAPKSILNGNLSAQRRSVCQSWPQARLANLAKKLDVTLNDVFLAMCAGGLRRYLMSQNALPSQAITACVPVAITSDKAQDGGNAISTVIANLGTHLVDPEKRLACITQSMRSAKQMLSGMSPNGILAYTVLSGMPAMVEQLVGGINRLPPMYNLVISNVPGPKKPLYWNGAKLEHSYPISLLPAGQNLNITLFSYAGSLDVSMVACRRRLPHMQRLIDHLEEALAELEALAGPAAE